MYIMHRPQACTENAFTIGSCYDWSMVVIPLLYWIKEAHLALMVVILIILYSQKIWRFGDLPSNQRIKIHQNSFLHQCACNGDLGLNHQI